MALITKKIKGTEDVLPKESYKWQFVEKIMREEARSYGFREIRTPVLNTQSFLPVVSVRQPMLFRKKCTHSTQRAAKA